VTKSDHRNFLRSHGRLAVSKKRIGKLLKRSNISKEKGISPVAVFRMLFTLVFSGKSLYRTLEAEGSCGMRKDTVYRFLNSVHTHWRRFLLLLSSQVIRQDLKPLTDAGTMKVLIADDTLYRRNRSKQVELLSRVFDHTDHRLLSRIQDACPGLVRRQQFPAHFLHSAGFKQGKESSGSRTNRS